MALETVVFPQELFGHHACKELVSIDGGEWMMDENWELSCTSMVVQNFEEEWEIKSSSTTLDPCKTAIANKRKRRESKSLKNKEEIESQRMIHIATERNRRKLMNEYLAVLRSLMPASYSQKGDQASIVGGAINYVKELEQVVQTLEAHKRMKQGLNVGDYSELTSSSCNGSNDDGDHHEEVVEMVRMDDIEVKMVENHASLKVLLKKKPKQLLKLVLGLQGLRLTTFHLNITTLDQMVLYSFSLKVEEDCGLSSSDEIVNAVHEIIRKDIIDG
ncbi:Myc-type basic helix-loop-helix (bHLH) domain-containing protein [Dioscorea alata]|uniref:Myc-type basic helix-loop-helix (BHLH) domain-containing protein n=1 Tax=Dioscorea alata TaxID=55571 RepID=A0ACB7U2Z0_DIOAL|nr:Myc-type basic helix-loop-helix (bHLH) domain-containing protein [Dioscorea alata]